jgi:hypothetical protein|tara:strand:+ start:131 stop:427 length:297 start_codon:yes stop_codon:yes gene_type:complete
MANEIPGLNINWQIIINLLSIVLTVFAIFYLTNKECIQHTDCGPDAYCGVDDKCQDFPVEKQQSGNVVKEQNSLVLLSAIISISLIIGSIIYVKRVRK